MRTFLGQRALVICREGRDRSILVKQLNRLGLAVTSLSPENAKPCDTAAVLFFDLDCGRDLAPSVQVGDMVKGPCIALLSSDTPSVIEWIIAQGAGSFLTKPLGHTGVLASLIMAFDAYESRIANEKAITKLNHRLKARRIVCSAIIKLMHAFNINEDEGFRLLRTSSMKHRTHIEAMAAMIMSGEVALPGNDQLEERRSYPTSGVR